MKVLIVEDDSALHVLYGHVFKNAGYEIFNAFDGREAITILESGIQPDLIMLDIRMPHVNGIEVLEYLQEYPGIEHVHVVIASASLTFKDYVPMIPSADFLLKPVLPAQLIKIAANVRAAGTPL